MFVKDLENLKYAELQKLAKSVGIKANQKIDKLIQALKNHYIETETNSDQEKLSSDQTATITQNAPSSTKEQSSAEPPKADVQIVNGVNTPENKMRRKRRRTFELDTPTLGFENTPTSDGPKKAVQAESKGSTEMPQNKRVRRNTFNKDSPKGDENKPVSRTSGSPGTKAIIDSIKADMNSPERREMILSAIDKKVQKEKESQPSQIPRYMAYLANKKLEAQQPKPPTPGNKNWNKIHDIEFSRFDSIDVYLEKKQQRMESLTGSAKKSSHLSAGTGARAIKPVIRARRPNAQPTKNQSFTLTKTPSTEKKETKIPSKPFMPSVTSVKNLNFNFLKSPTVNGVNSENKEVASVKKTHLQTTTPFKFTGNQTCLNSTVSSTKKCFDLKASLAKPLSWKPHTGKLMPLDKKVSAVVSARPTRQSLASKTRPTQAKDVQRVKQLDRRNNQKYLDMMKRRGLMN